MAFVPTPGVGEWSVPRYYGPACVSEPMNGRVRLAIYGIQLELIRTGFLVADVRRLDGTYGSWTTAAVKLFQFSQGFTTRQQDGLYGRQTGTAMFTRHFHWHEAVNGLPLGIIWGQRQTQETIDPR